MEYIVLVGLVALVAIGGFRAYGRSIDDKAKEHAACVSSLSCGGQGNGDGNEAMIPSRGSAIDGAAGQGDGDDGDDGGGGGFWGGLWNQASNFVEGAVLGSFGGNTGWAGFAGKVAVGFIPIVGQIADARDTVWALGNIIQNPTSPKAWADLGVTAIAWVPGVGNAVANSIKGGAQLRHALPGISRWVSGIRLTYGAGNQAAKGEPDE